MSNNDIAIQIAIQFALERNYECARQCLLDACFAAFKRLGLKYEPFGLDALEAVEKRWKELAHD